MSYPNKARAWTEINDQFTAATTAEYTDNPSYRSAMQQVYETIQAVDSTVPPVDDMDSASELVTEINRWLEDNRPFTVDNTTDCEFS